MLSQSPINKSNYAPTTTEMITVGQASTKMARLVVYTATFRSNWTGIVKCLLKPRFQRRLIIF